MNFVRSSIPVQQLLVVSSCFSVFMFFSFHLIWGGGQGGGSFMSFCFSLPFFFCLLFLKCTKVIMAQISYFFTFFKWLLIMFLLHQMVTV